MSASFTKLATVTASTKRNPAAVNGKIGAPATNLTGVLILPVMPLSPELAISYRIQSPREAFVTFTQSDTDIIEGDILIVGSDEYRVRGVGNWSAIPYLEIVLEQVKGV